MGEGRREACVCGWGGGGEFKEELEETKGRRGRMKEGKWSTPFFMEFPRVTLVIIKSSSITLNDLYHH